VRPDLLTTLFAEMSSKSTTSIPRAKAAHENVVPVEQKHGLESGLIDSRC
jgi:hypothetical protein